MTKKPLWIATLGSALALATVSTQAQAGDPVAGMLIGGGIGAAVAGPPGAAVGAILGSLAASDPYYDRGYYGRGYYAPRYAQREYYAAPAYYPPAAAYYAPGPAYYNYEPAYYGPGVVYRSERRYAEAPRYARGGYERGGYERHRSYAEVRHERRDRDERERR
jgi:hypothetical protein